MMKDTDGKNEFNPKMAQPQTGINAPRNNHQKINLSNKK